MKSIWKSAFIVAILVCGLLAGYTVTNLNNDPEIPAEMVMPLFSVKSGPEATQNLISNFTQARNLSEDYLLTNEARQLMSIEQEFDRRILAIDQQLAGMISTEDKGLELIVANLIRLKGDFQRDAKDTFRLHRISLGLEG